MLIETDWQLLPPGKEKYQAYLASREWSLLREAVHERARGWCERCTWNPGDAVHHLTYARIYHEDLEDLILLCDGCHDFQHGKSDVDPRLVEPPPFVHSVNNLQIATTRPGFWAAVFAPRQHPPPRVHYHYHYRGGHPLAALVLLAIAALLWLVGR
jgi:hypothetical protein